MLTVVYVESHGLSSIRGRVQYADAWPSHRRGAASAYYAVPLPVIYCPLLAWRGPQAVPTVSPISRRSRRAQFHTIAELCALLSSRHIDMPHLTMSALMQTQNKNKINR
jgi:hypothetical protein